ncbi:MAG: amino acid ABC transporter substrate-binding protein [Actinomycetota bacterium]|nr:amino acid ABC transporter substrate-binding protein [Actinomycetota bacterium]
MTRHRVPVTGELRAAGNLPFPSAAQHTQQPEETDVNVSASGRGRPWRRAALPAAALVALAACAPSQSGSTGGGAGAGGGGEKPSKVVVGSTLPLTGTESKTGGRYKQGYELAVELENADGGLDIGGTKVPVELKLLDDTTNQGQAVQLAQRLITQDKVNAFLGTYTTALVEAQSNVAQQTSIPYVNGGGAATSIYSKGNPWIFSTLAPVENLATTEMQWIEQQQEAGKLPKPAKIAILWENTSHGQDFKKGIENFVAKQPGDYQVVVNESFALDGKDYSPLLSKVQASGADLFMADAHLPDFITMHRQYVGSGLCNKLITYGARGSEADAISQLGEKNTNYILSAVWWNAQLGDEGLNKSFSEAFQKKFGATPEWQHAVAYEAARTLFTAIDQADSVDKTKVRDTLRGLQIDSILPGGKLDFPDNGQALYPFVVQQNLPGGKAPIIFPDDVKTADGVAPNPNCKG